MELTIRTYDIDKPELNCFGSNTVHPLFVWSQAHIDGAALESLAEYRDSSFHHIAFIEDREPRLYEWCIDNDNELKFVYEINKKTGLAREEDGSPFILDGCLRVVTGSDPVLTKDVYVDSTNTSIDDPQKVFGGLALIKPDDLYLLPVMFNEAKLSFPPIKIELVSCVPDHVRFGRGSKRTTWFDAVEHIKNNDEFAVIPELQKYNPTNQIVRAAGKAVSEHVRAPKVVREGLVKPKKKTYTEQDMINAYNTGYSDHSRGLENNEGLNSIFDND